MDDVGGEALERRRYRVLEELKGLFGPAFGPALEAYGRSFDERIGQDEGFRTEVRNRFERGHALGGFPGLSALLFGMAPEEQREFFEAGWTRVAPPPPEESCAFWTGDREAYREDLYVGLAVAFTDLRAFAQEWLEELRARGVHLQAEDLTLHVDSRAGAVTDGLRATLREYKRNLIRLLEREPLRFEAADRRGLLIRRACEPGYVSIHDPTTGEWHQVEVSGSQTLRRSEEVSDYVDVTRPLYPELRALELAVWVVDAPDCGPLDYGIALESLASLPKVLGSEA